MLTIAQRLCWNTRGWRLPSGRTQELGFPSAEGFGLEEWNFQTEDAFNGHIYGYGFIRPSSAILRRAGGVVRVIFFAIHPTTKEKFLAGCYEAAQVVPDNDFARLFTHFDTSGIFDRRANELRQAVPTIADEDARTWVRDSVRKKWLSYRCPVSLVSLPPRLEPLSHILGSRYVSHRFRGFTYVDSKNVPATLTRRNQRQVVKSSTPLVEDAYYRETAQNLKVIIPRHKKLSNSFCAWLRSQRISPVQEKERVDVQFCMGNQTVMVEIKVCYGVGTTKSIREALGQLLEYNHYIGQRVRDRWLILLDEKPTTADFNWIGTLRNTLNLPVYLGWREASAFQFEKKWLAVGAGQIQASTPRPGKPTQTIQIRIKSPSSPNA